MSRTKQQRTPQKPYNRLAKQQTRIKHLSTRITSLIKKGGKVLVYGIINSSIQGCYVECYCCMVLNFQLTGLNCHFQLRAIVIFLQVNSRTVICSDHFTLDSFFWKRSALGKRRRFLIPAAVPTLFNWTFDRKQRHLLKRGPASIPGVDFDTSATFTGDKDSIGG